MEAILNNTESGVLKDKCTVEAVIANKASAGGLAIAREHGISTLVVESKELSKEAYNQELVAKLQEINPDFIVLAGYMKILANDFVRAFKGRIINIHPADTSAHQGLHAYEWAFEEGLKKTYITVHYVDEGVDTGAVIGKAEVDLDGAETLEEVEKRGLSVEHRFYSAKLAEIFS